MQKVYKNIGAKKYAQNIGVHDKLGAANVGGTGKTRRPRMLAEQEKIGARQCWRSRKI
jgi:uncharacterized protein YaiL (DUF2058 family)